MKKLLTLILFFPLVSLATTAIPWVQPTLSSPFFYPNLTNGSNLRVLIGQTTEPTGSTFNDLVDVASSTPNDFAAVGIWNTNTGTCASAEYDANNNHSTLTTNYLSLGITGGNFTGVGCANNPFPAFGADSAYSIITNGNYNWAIGSTSASAQFRWLSDTNNDSQYTTADTKMILTQGGFLGIGSTTPDAPLTISNNLTSFLAPQTGTILHGAESGVNARISLDTYNGGASGSIIQGRKANGTNLLPTAAILDNSLALIGGDGYGTSKFHDASVGAIAVRAEGTFTDTSAPSYLAFFTAPINTTSSVERVRIASTGNMGIGTTSPLAKLDVAGTLGSQIDLFNVSSTTATNVVSGLFKIQANGNVGIGTTTPIAKLSVQASSGDILLVATSSTKTVAGYDSDGHYFTSGPAPAISSCGTGTGTVLGDDQGGTITTATLATSCTMTFAKAYQGNGLYCTVTDDSLAGFADVSSTSTTAVTFGISSALTGGHLYYQCAYHR